MTLMRGHQALLWLHSVHLMQYALLCWCGSVPFLFLW